MLNKELEDFYRHINLKSHFKNHENKANFTEEHIFRKPTNQIQVAYNNHHSIETFIEATRNEINNEIEKTKQPVYSNLSVKEQKALQELQSRDNIVITDAVKGGMVVIFDVEDYIKETERQIHKTENYNNETVNKIIRFQQENLICKNIAEGMKSESPKSSQFYLKQKLKKVFTSKISKYVEYHLQLMFREILSKTLVTYYKKLIQLNSLQKTPTSHHLT